VQHEGLGCFCELYTPSSARAIMAEKAFALSLGECRYPTSPPAVS